MSLDKTYTLIITSEHVYKEEIVLNAITREACLL